MNPLQEKGVLITGGGGFIGKALVEQVLHQQPRFVRVFDKDQQQLFRLKRRFESHHVDTEFMLGNLRDEHRVSAAVEDVDTVFHAAAIKHVGMCEYQPEEAVLTNIEGTRNLIQAVIESGVRSCTAVSTDKASTPTSVMGSTKMIMERLVIAANTRCGPETCFNCVRFGNVLGSTGSVVPIFLDQIRDGGPITVTNPDMTRFIMLVDRAVELVLEAYRRIQQGRVGVLKMPAFRVGDLAEGLKQQYAPQYGYRPDDIDTKIIGKRPGERMHEKLVSGNEVSRTREHEDMYVIYPQIELGESTPSEPISNSLTREYTSNQAELLDPLEIAEMIEDTDVETQLVEA